MKLAIGIDPGTKTGFAVKDVQGGKFTQIATFKIHEAMAIVEQLASEGHDISVTVEDARLRTWFGKSGREVLQGVGSVKRDCTIWQDFLKDLKIKARFVKPVSGGTKWDEAVWRRKTGWQGRTSEHARDAAILVL